jgi:hypothetical protein
MKWLEPITPTGKAGEHFPFGNFQTALVVPVGTSPSPAPTTTAAAATSSPPVPATTVGGAAPATSSTPSSSAVAPVGAKAISSGSGTKVVVFGAQPMPLTNRTRLSLSSNNPFPFNWNINGTGGKSNGYSNKVFEYYPDRQTWIKVRSKSLVDLKLTLARCLNRRIPVVLLHQHDMVTQLCSFHHYLVV